VPYEVLTVPAVIDYLSRLAENVVSPDVIAALMKEYTQELGERADFYLQNSPVAHESYSFQFESVQVVGDYLYEFNFIVDASSAPFGVVSIIYVDYHVIGERET